ncbi:MAG: aminotransferase class V-fold PLP-dependent enzyme [Chitinophagaceae bacterium]|nr:aminotransferase class V-fold PLP-dependent enzyme [Chitinophagaceae bacterium]
MKRRDVIKGLTILPLGSAIPSAVSAADVPSTAAGNFAKGNIFESIGVEPLINCRGTFTIIGGSLERPAVRAAMEAASSNFVQYDELADGIGKKLAELTGAEWGMVSAGCAAGLKHITAACVTGGNPEKLIRIPDLTGFEKTEVIIPRNARNAYDHAIRNIGVTIITVESMEELKNAISSRTAMIYLMSNNEKFKLEELSAIAKAKNVPVLVDAAAEDFTVPNIHLKAGADIVAYSGGKALCGPQCAGLLLGRKDILMSAWQASSPHHGPGRDNKVGREEMMGMLAAVEEWIRFDHDAKWKRWLGYLDTINKAVTKVDGVTTELHEPEGLDNKSPTLKISWDIDKLNISGEEVAEELGRSKPRIALGGGGARGYDSGPTNVTVTTGQMQPGEDKIVAQRIVEVLKRSRPARSKEMKAPAGNIGGRWDADIQFFSSTSKHTLNIEQDGNWLQGSHKGDFTVRDMVGTIDGDVVKLRSTDRIPGDNITFIFTGTLAGDTLSGSIYMGEYRTASFTAKRYGYKNKRSPISVPGGPPLAT